MVVIQFASLLSQQASRLYFCLELFLQWIFNEEKSVLIIYLCGMSKFATKKTKKVCFAFSFTKITIKSLLNIPSVLRLHYIACYNVIMIGSYNYSCSKGQTARLFFFHLPLGCRWEPFYQEKYIFSNFSCRFLSPNIFFQFKF